MVDLRALEADLATAADRAIRAQKAVDQERARQGLRPAPKAVYSFLEVEAARRRQEQMTMDGVRAIAASLDPNNAFAHMKSVDLDDPKTRAQVAWLRTLVEAHEIVRTNGRGRR